MKNLITGFLKYLYISTTIFFLVLAGIALSILLIGVVNKSSSYNLDSIVRENFNLPKSEKGYSAHSKKAGNPDSSAEPKNEYHQNKKQVQEDKWSFCVDCHGAADHSKTKEVRSFLNMHSQFISCEVCHVNMKDPSEPAANMGFGWVDLKEGKLTPNPDLTQGVWGNYGAKVVQVTGENSNPAPFVLEEERDFYLKIKAGSVKPDSLQEEQNNKELHKNLLEKPLACIKCHSTKEKFFPYLELGYSEARKDFLVNSEVVDLINNLDTFFIPSLIHSEQESEAKSGKANP